jgi:hypothetical protein
LPGGTYTHWKAPPFHGARQNLPPTTLPKTPAIGVEFSESCQRDVPKSCNFNGSADALGGRAFWNIKI